jgi:hypothetical protein
MADDLPHRDALSLDTIVVADPGQISSELDGETVILSLKTGLYYGLNAVGARVWELLREPKRVLQLRDVILKEYDVGAEQCEKELLELVGGLAGRGLIEVKISPATEVGSSGLGKF